jgi:hypothetical protein
MNIEIFEFNCLGLSFKDFSRKCNCCIQLCPFLKAPLISLNWLADGKDNLSDRKLQSTILGCTHSWKIVWFEFEN